MSFLFRNSKDSERSKSFGRDGTDGGSRDGLRDGAGGGENEGRSSSMPDSFDEQEALVNETAQGRTDYLSSQAASSPSSEAEQGGVRRWRASSPKHAMRTARKDAVLEACARWREELQRRASLKTNADIVRKATVDLTHIHPTGAAQLFSGAPTMLSSLVREERSYQRAVAQMSELNNAIMRLRDSYGYVTLSLTAGRAVWKPLRSEPVTEVGETEMSQTQVAGDTPQQESGAKDQPEKLETSALPPAQMPMLLRPAKVEFLANGDAKISIARSIEMYPDFRGALVEAGAAEAELDAALRLESSAGIDSVIARLAELGRSHMQHFEHEPQALLGCFIHPAESLLKDFDAVKPFIEGSQLVAALAGDERMRGTLSAPLPRVSAKDRAPELERGVGDCDVDEQSVTEVAASGRSFVIDCPPGSKRLAAIVSIAADAAATGRSVIIVPAHASDADALQRECEQAGVGELALNFWEKDSVALRLRLGLRLEKPQIDKDAIVATRSQLIDRRTKLSAFVNDLHRKDPEWETSVHDVLQELAELTSQPDGPRTRVRFTEENIHKIHDAGFDVVEADLMSAAELGILDGSYSQSLWFTSGLSKASEVEHALRLAYELSDSVVPKVIQESAEVSQRTGLIPAETPQQWVDQVSMLDGISESLDTFLPKVFERSPEDMVIATATKEWRDARGYQMKGSMRRLIRKQAEDLLRPGAAPKDIHAELKLVQERQELWRKHSADGGWPVLPPNFSQIRAQSSSISAKFSELSELFGGTDFIRMPWHEITAVLNTLKEEDGHTDSLPERNLLLRKLFNLGLDVFIEDMKARGISGEALRQEFRLACTSSVFEQLMAASPVLASLGPQDISALLASMRELDKEHISSLAEPVLEAAISNMRDFARAHRDSTLSLDAILARDDATAVKEGIRAYPRIMQLARPIWIMPAGLIAEFVPCTPWADLMILDVDADVSLSSVLPAMARGRQLVVVGDTRRPQLLEASGAEGADSEQTIPDLAISAYAQILPVMPLPTHRVQLNELTTLALSQHGYSGVYSSIPHNPRLHSAHLQIVEGRGMPSLGGDGAVETTATEVNAVIDAIVIHALDRPHESLAVIAGNERHASRIREAFKKEIADSAVLCDFARQNEAEPFDVIDISQAAGLRRDRIILSCGYGKTMHGRVLHSFGMLATPAGFIGLVNAIEAARGDLSVISALGPDDFDKNHTATPGPALLAGLIEAADKGFESSASQEESASLPPLIDDVAARLEKQGWLTARNFGYEGSERIPLVVGSKDIPGVWAVAVLLDDEGYVNEASLRRRDRYRVEAYEKAGWKVFQTYSASLFIDPVGQAQQIAALVESVRDSLRQPEKAQVVVPNLEASEDAVTELAGSPQELAPEKETPSREEKVAHTPMATQKEAEPIKPRAARPEIPVGLPLAAYTDDQLEDMLAWICSDNISRTAEELREELRKELGIERRGGQIDRVLANVVRRCELAQESSDHE